MEYENNESDFSLDLSKFNGALNSEECILLVVDEEYADVKSDSQFVLSNELRKWLKSLSKMVEDLVALDPVAERRSKVQKDIFAAISCYIDNLEEKLNNENSDLSESLSVLDDSEEYEQTKERKKETRYTCEFCAVSFTSPLYLKKHMDSCLNGLTQPTDSLYCPQCGVYFSNTYNHRRHMYKHINKNKINPRYKRLKLVDLKQQDIDKAIDLLSNSNAKINGNMEIKIKKEEKSVCKLKKDGKSEFEDGEIIDKTNSFERLESQEEEEIPSKILKVYSHKGIVKDHDKVAEEYQVLIVGENHSNAAKKTIIEEIPLKCRELDGKMIAESKDEPKLIEKHKLGIISDHILGNRNQYWSDVELKCVCCGYISASPDECEDHMKDKHENVKPFACNYCDQLFISIGGLKKHTLENHKAEANEESLNKSSKKQMNIKIYRCRVCQKKFNRSDALKSHERRHLGIVKTSKTGEIILAKQKSSKPPSLLRIECEICGGSYSNQANLRKHMAVHIGEPQYVCQHCGKRFLKRDCLTYHLRIHTKEKPWNCDICLESFSERRSWLIHSNNHKGLRPYRCERCPMRYVDRRLLNKHIAAVHNGQFKPKTVYQPTLKETKVKKQV